MSYAALVEAKYDGHLRDNGWFRMSCVFHVEKDASLDINTETGGFKCWGCGKTGFLVDIISKTDHCSMQDAYDIINGHRPIGGKSSIIGEKKITYLDEDILDIFPPIQHDGHCAEYLYMRGIRLDWANDYNLAEGTPIEPGWGMRVVFPIRDLAGNLCSVEGRAIADQEPRYKKWTGSQATNGVFGIDAIPKKEFGLPLIVAEGTFDVLSILQAGYNAVGMNCSDISERQLVMLKKVTKFPAVIYDGRKPGTDEARIEAIKRVRGQLSRYFAKYKIIEIPYADTDPNDLWLAGDLEKYLKKTTPMCRMN